MNFKFICKIGMMFMQNFKHSSAPKWEVSQNINLGF